MKPSAMQKLFPDLPEEDWPTYGPVEKDTVYLLPNAQAGDPAEADAAAVPQPRQPRHVGRAARPLAGAAGRGRRACTSSARPPAPSCSWRTAAWWACDRATRAAAATAEPLSNFEPGADLIAKATVLCEGTQGHLTGAAIRHFELGSEDPQQWELGVKEVWEVEKPLDRVIHTMGWPLHFAAKYREFGGSFIYPMGEDTHLDGPGGGARLPRRALLGARRAPGAEGPPAGGRAARGRQAGGLGREDAALGRLLGAAAAALGARHGDLRRRRRDGQRADAQGRALRDARRDVRRGGDLRAAEGRRRLRRPVELRSQGRGLRDPEGHLPLAQHAPAVRQGLPRGRGDREHDGDLGRAAPAGALGDARRRRRSTCSSARSGSTRSRTARRRSTSSPRCSRAATRPATTPPTTSASRRRSRWRWR